MKILFAILTFLLFTPFAQAHDINIKGYKDNNSSYISKCNNKYYGYHKQKGKNHWHEVKYVKNEWKIVDANKSYNTDPCVNNIKETAFFVKCVDGDTAVLKTGNKELKYRFLGVDTPESVHPTKEVEAYAKEASKNTCDLLTNATSIKVEYDSNSDKTDKYGRQLAWIWVDDILLQELMISEGFARVAYIYGDYKYIDNLCSLEQQAIDNNKGIWAYGYEVGYCETKSNVSTDVDASNIYKVTFESNDEAKEIAVAQGMKVKEIEPESKLGYKFVGWYRDNKKFNFNTPINSNITIVAKYKIDYIYIALVIAILAIGIINNIKDEKHGKSNKKSVKYNRKKRI